MKLKTIAAVLTLSLASQTVSVPRAHAIAGIVLTAAGGAGIPLIVTGGVVSGVGIGMMTLPDDNFWDRLYWFIVGIPVTAVGILLLDGKAELAAPQYHALTSKQAEVIGLTDRELASYNSEIDEVNAQCQSLTSILGAMKKPTMDDSRALWSKAKELFAPETISALEKVTLYVHGQIYEKARN